MSRFIAVPVGQGDAFYLESEGWSVLVDGGRNRSGFASLFTTTTRATGVDIAVCTHNDADHANGILGFLEAGLKCGEVWLPSRWLGALPSVLKPFVEVFVDLAHSVAEVPPSWDGELQHGAGLSAMEKYAEQFGESVDQVRSNEQEPPIGEDGWPELYVALLEQAEPWEIWPMHCPWPEFAYGNYRHLGPRRTQLLWSAIEAASRIRAIAMEAFHRGIPVRWFEFDLTAPSGVISAFQPLNARAVARVSPVVGRLLDWLALTVSNKESLVFWCPPRNQDPGVLFTADSDLKGISLPLPPKLEHALVTAPHHGSEANVSAYNAVAAATSSVTWVRSDGKFRGRPGRTYRSLPSPRFCTLCWISGSMASPKQAVHLAAQAGVWTPQGATSPCRC